MDVEKSNNQTLDIIDSVTGVYDSDNDTYYIGIKCDDTVNSNQGFVSFKCPFIYECRTGKSPSFRPLTNIEDVESLFLIRVESCTFVFRPNPYVVQLYFRHLTHYLNHVEQQEQYYNLSNTFEYTPDVDYVVATITRQ